MFEVLDAIEEKLGAVDDWIREHFGWWASIAATWCFHGLMGFLLGFIFGEVGVGGAIGAYATREVSQARKWSWSLDSTMDLVFPAFLSVAGALVRSALLS